MILLYSCQQEEGRFFSLPGNSSANEKPLYFKSPVSSSRLFVCNSLSQLPLLLYKRVSPPLFCWTCMCLTILALSKIAILCCSWINLCCWQNNWLFYYFMLINQLSHNCYKFQFPSEVYFVTDKTFQVLGQYMDRLLQIHCPFFLSVFSHFVLFCDMPSTF